MLPPLLWSWWLLLLCTRIPTVFIVIADAWFFFLEQVALSLHQSKAFNPSSSRANPPEKHIQVISVDNHEFWFRSSWTTTVLWNVFRKPCNLTLYIPFEPLSFPVPLPRHVTLLGQKCFGRAIHTFARQRRAGNFCSDCFQVEIM